MLINSDKKLAVSRSWNLGTNASTQEGVVSIWHLRVLSDGTTLEHYGLNEYAMMSATK